MQPLYSSRALGMNIPALRQRLEEDGLLALTKRDMEQGLAISLLVPAPESVD